jgi:hypothetical protein
VTVLLIYYGNRDYNAHRGGTLRSVCLCRACAGKLWDAITDPRSEWINLPAPDGAKCEWCEGENHAERPDRVRVPMQD